MKKCMYCGAEIADDSLFCGKCGKKQVQKYTQVFRRDKLSEEDFFARINQWFAQYPRVANVRAEFQLRNGTGLFVNKYVAEALAIEYELLEGNNENQYAVLKLETSGLVKTNTDTLLAKWQQKNPGAVIVQRQGGVHQRGQAGNLILGGIGAVNKTQLYIVFKFNRRTGTGNTPLPSGK